MVTFFDWGQYAIWHKPDDLRVSMDGRRETVYSERSVDLHLDMYLAKAGWPRVSGRLAGRLRVGTERTASCRRADEVL